jgi:hypothetical protein
MDRLDILCQPWTDVCRIRADLSADRKKGAHIQRDDAAQVLADESLCAEAVQIYAPGAQSVLEQARAASAANAETGAAPALPAPAKGKPGRRPKVQTAAAPSTSDTQAANAGTTVDSAPEVDPRQTSLLESSAGAAEAAQTNDGDTPPAAATDAAPAAAGDEGIDLL